MAPVDKSIHLPVKSFTETNSRLLTAVRFIPGTYFMELPIPGTALSSASIDDSAIITRR